MAFSLSRDDAAVLPGEVEHVRAEVSETYLGDSVEMGRAHRFQSELIDRAGTRPVQYPLRERIPT